MKRDMDLIRTILLALEQRPLSVRYEWLEIPGRTQEEISYHVQMLHQYDLVEAIDASSRAGIAWMPGHLTMAGHDFLDAARDDKRWKSVLARAASKAGTVTLDILKQLLTDAIKAQLAQ